jgi:hypothetical protein
VGGRGRNKKPMTTKKIILWLNANKELWIQINLRELNSRGMSIFARREG